MSLRDEQIELYSRQIILPQLGGVGQRRFLAAHCLVRGGGPAFASVVTYLTGSGIGRLDLEPTSREDLLAFAPPEERNPDVALGRPGDRDEPPAYDVVVETDFGRKSDELPQRIPIAARLGEIAVEAGPRTIRLRAVPASVGCLDCLAPRPRTDQNGPVTEMALAGTIAALTALRWIMAAPGKVREPISLELPAGAPTWTSASLQQAPTCPRPCRPSSVKLTS